MSDSVTNLVGNAEPRTAAAAGFQNAKVPLSDLFANVLDKTTFADRMLPQSDFGLARAAERDYEVRQDIRDEDQDHADARPADDTSEEVRDTDERSQDSDDSEAESQTDEQPQDDGLSDDPQFSAESSEDSLLALNAAAHNTEHPALTVQPNSVSGVELQSKADGAAAGQARAIVTGGDHQAAAQSTAKADNAHALGQDAMARANAALSNNQSGANGQKADAATVKAGPTVEAAAGEKPQSSGAPVLAQSQGAAEGDADGLVASFEKHALLLRAGAKRAAELHHMKIRLVAHRDAIKEAISQSSAGSNTSQTQTAASGAKPSVEITTSATPPAAAALEGPTARPASLFNAQTAGTLPGQAGANGSPTLAIGDTVGNGVEQSTASADRPAMTSNASRGLNLRPTSSLPTYQPAEQVKVHIQPLVKSESDRIQVKLSPASLGRVEVMLEVSPDKVVHAIVYAEKPETLDMLERDARVLQQAFEEAGMKFDSDNLMFKHGQSGDSDAELKDGSASTQNGASAEGDGSEAGETAANEQPSRRQHDGMLDLEI